MINMQKADRIVKLYTEKLILSSDPLFPLWNRENSIFSKPSRWNYIDGCMIKAVLMLYELSFDERLLEYAVRFMDCYVSENGSIPTMNPLDYNLDNVNGGKNLIYLFKKTKKEKYRLAFEKLYTAQLINQPRLKCGNFFHKAIYPFQIWLDGAYMALPFLAEYAILHDRKSIISDIIRQLRNIDRIMRDKSTGLYYHGFDETRSMNWTDGKTGLSGEFWLRSMGWFCAALADLCEIAADAPELFCLCRDMLDSLLTSLSDCISDDNMLYQLPAKPDLKGNYPETSGTLLFVYSALKAHRLGICGDKIKTDGIRTLSAVIDNFIEVQSENMPVLKNICLVAGLGGCNARNGSATYYLNEPVVENDAKGIAPFLMSYTEMKRITVL